MTAACGREPASVAPAGAAGNVTGALRLRVEDGLDREIAEPAAARVAAQAGTVVVVDGGPADVALRRAPAPGPAVAASVRHWAVFTCFWSMREDVSPAELRQAAASGLLLLPADERVAVMAMLGPDAAGGRWLAPTEMVDAVTADARMLALMPVEASTPRLRALAVEGIDIVRGLGDPAGYALTEKVYVTGLTPEGAEAVPLVAAAIEVPPPAAVRIAFTGDIIPARCVYARQRAANDFTRAFQATADYLSSADLAVGSLDASISGAGTPIACAQTFNLLAPPRSVEGLTFAGFDVVTVATNHAKDCGEGACDRAILDTLTNLSGAGIATVGGGADLADARRPAVLEAGGVRFAFLGYDDVASSAYGASAARPGTAPLDASTLAQDIAVARTLADVVIVLPHWGVEYTADPTGRQTAIARQAIDAGAALVAGNHPHVVQAVEWHGDGFIAYALGNFVFDQDWSLETQQGMVLEATFHGTKLAGVRLLPVRIYDMHQPRWAGALEGRQILDRVMQASE
jgi:poly-gamma-glutamate synthesis protein (capsule biosynthesis protein)